VVESPAFFFLTLADHRQMIGRIVRLVRWPLLLLLIGALAWISWYGYARGFGRRWRGLLEKEFDRYGLSIDVNKLTLDPFHGLIARDVAIFDSKSGDTLLAEINNISLDINYANLFQHEPALNAVDLSGARIVIPVDPSNPSGEKIRFTDFHARIYFLAGRIEIRQASGKLYGIRFDASGTILHPEALSTVVIAEERDPDSPNERLGFLNGILQELKAIHYPGQTPEVKFSFQADLMEPAEWRLDGGHLMAARLLHGDDELRNLTADFTYQNHCLRIARCHVQDGQGELFAVADWDFQSGKKQFQVRSTLNVGSLLKDEPRVGWLRDWVFSAPPQIELTGTLQRNGTLQFIGKLNFERFTVQGVPFQSMRASFSQQGDDAWMISNAEVTHRSGTLTGEILQTPEKFRLRVQSALDPAAISPLLPEEVRSMCAAWEFLAPPVIQVSLSGSSPRPEEISGSSQAWLGRTRFRGAFLNSASASFRVGDGKVVAENVQVARDEGTGNGSFTYDLLGHQISAINAQAHLHLSALANWVDPKLAGLTDAFRFNAVPLTVLESVDGSAGREDCGVSVKIHSTEPFSLRWGVLELPFDNGDSEFQATSKEIRLTRLTGKIGAGVCSANATVALNTDNPAIQAKLRFDQINPAKLGLVSHWLQPYSGRLTGTLNMHQLNRNEAVVTGSIRLAQAEFEDAPLFQPIINRLRAVGLQGPSTLDLQFESAGENVTVNTLKLWSTDHSLNLSGSIGLLGGVVDLSGAVDGEALLAHVTGTIESPEWQVVGPKR
jgi:hypothetical protein